MTDTCKTCKFNHPDERPEYADSGECRRYPPQVTPWTHPDYKYPQYDQHWPWTGQDNWCGEYVKETASD